MTVNFIHLVGTDDIFIEQRRRGLYRFINFIGNHPVLQNDETVIDFLKVQTVTYKMRNHSLYFILYSRKSKLTKRRISHPLMRSLQCIEIPGDP